MLSITNKTAHDVLCKEGTEYLAKILLKLPQADAPLYHRFGPGIYIREVHMPAGTLAIGHHQKFEQWNSFLKGRILMLNEDGTTKELVAPMQFTGNAGRKVGYILEDVVWQNIFPNPDNEHDIEKLEAKWIEKSEGWLASDAIRISIERIEHDLDRADYLKVLEEFGCTEEIARSQSENMEDQTDMEIGRIQVGISSIEGKGLFATAPIKSGEVIGPARFNGKRTICGRYTNHSSSPNAQFLAAPNGDIVMVAIKDISGCKGGQLVNEITVDYRQSRRAQLKAHEIMLEEK